MSTKKALGQSLTGKFAPAKLESTIKAAKAAKTNALRSGNRAGTSAVIKTVADAGWARADVTRIVSFVMGREVRYQQIKNTLDAYEGKKRVPGRQARSGPDPEVAQLKAMVAELQAQVAAAKKSG